MISVEMLLYSLARVYFSETFFDFQFGCLENGFDFGFWGLGGNICFFELEFLVVLLFTPFDQ